MSVALVILCCLPVPALAQGIYIPVAGPVNRSMGGTTTAAPLDAIGALYWNPATIAGLPESELAFGADLLIGVTQLSSSVGPVSGSTKGLGGGALLPNIGWVQRLSNPKLTFGLGITSVAGFKTNYPSSFTNPILTPQPNGVGRLYSEAQFAQVSPALSYRVTERVAIAAGPMLTFATLAADPLLFVAPNLNGYASGRAQMRFGGGVQAGVFVDGEGDWNFGASIKSPQWIQAFEYNAEDAIGGPRSGSLDLDLPMIISVGTAYRGFRNILWTVDYRYFDYSRTAGLGDDGFDAEGALRGVGWRSVSSISTGIQYQLRDGLVVRGGYGRNQAPVTPENTGLNIASPLVQEQVFHIGGSLRFDRPVNLNFAYSYFPVNEVTGPIQTFIDGPLPDSSVTNRLSVHTFSMGVTVRY